MGEKVWNKFHPVFGPDLKVGFETTFPRGAILELDPLYEKSGLVYKPPNEKIVRVYEPAKVMGSCCEGRMVNILFVPVVPQRGTLFRRLMFTRKIEKGQPRRWITMARHEEAAPFGFDSWNSKNPKYLTLAYPDQEEFVPVYVKIQNIDGNFVYLELSANDDEAQVLFSASRVNENMVPKHLLSATT